jgi:nucleoside-diphosphate-sugar epimerase
MRVLVTGGAGRLGLRVSKLLLEHGYQVRILDIDGRRNRQRVEKLRDQAEIRWADVRDAEAIRPSLEGIDTVVHMAAILPPKTDQYPDLARSINVEGTRTVIDAIRQSGRDIPVVYSSSISVFGATPDAVEPVSPERNPAHPEEVYSQTKFDAENAIRESGVGSVILRLPAAFDLDASAIKLIYRVPLNNRFEFCHPDDTILAIVNAVRFFDAVRGTTLVVCGGPAQRMTYKDILGGALGVLGLPLPPARKFSQTPYCVDWYDTSASQELLRYQTKTFDDFRRDLGRTIAGPLSPVVVPVMRYFIGPVFGRIIVRFF